MYSETSEPLENLVLSYHCPINWDSMDGDERERFCKQCSKSVFNISDLNKKEANEYLQKKSDASHCVKFYLRSDGTITTDECPRILRPVRNTARYLGRVAVGLVSVLIYSVSNLIPLLAKDDNDSELTSAASIFKKNVDFRYRGTIMMGPTPTSEIGEQCKLLFNLVPTNDAEKNLLCKIPTDATRAKHLELASIQELVNYYKNTKQTDRYFLAKMIETSILVETSNLKMTEADLEQLEELQLKATDFIVTQAETKLSEGKQKEAENLAIYSLRLGECGKRIPYRDLYSPIKNTRWRVSPRYVKDMSVVMRKSTLKKLLLVLDKIEPDSVFADPDIEKIENPIDTANDTVIKLPSEPPRPEFYKKELLNTPIAVVAQFDLKRFSDKSIDSIPLRQDCFEVTKILKAPPSTQKTLEQTKLLRGKYTFPVEKPIPITAIRRRQIKREVILFIKSVQWKDSAPPYLHCEFGSVVDNTEEVESKLEKWVSQQSKASKSKRKKTQ